MAIPFVDLKAQYLSIKSEMDLAIQKCIDNTNFIGGQPLKDLEKGFSDLCKAKYTLGVSSGTSALHLALKAYNIGPGDEVIVPVNTFIATSEAVSSVGATPVFIDINEDTYTIDVDKISELITKKTKAILPVHLYGQPADMDPILDIANKNGLVVIEDAAQAHCAEYKGKSIPYGDTACFSFFPGKNLGAYGDAGAVVTKNEEVYKKIYMLRDHGREPGQKYKSTIEGFGHRLDTIQAAILNIKLKYITQWTERRRANAKKYNELLADTGCITPVEPEYSKHVYHLYVIRSKHRDILSAKLHELGISTGIHYPIPLHLQPAYSYLGLSEGSFPVTEKTTKEILSLPMYPELSIDQISFITESIKKSLFNL